MNVYKHDEDVFNDIFEVIYLKYLENTVNCSSHTIMFVYKCAYVYLFSNAEIRCLII